MIVEINNQIDEKLNTLIEKTLLDVNYVLVGKGVIADSVTVQMSVAVVSPSEIQQLNEQYRQLYEPTDVLSFLYEKDAKQLSGEIIICPEIIQKYAAEDGVAFEQELKKNLVHGFLHNLGYEHGESMFALQQEILQTIQ